jgi:hypothetical protein
LSESNNEETIVRIRADINNVYIRHLMKHTPGAVEWSEIAAPMREIMGMFEPGGAYFVPPYPDMDLRHGYQTKNREELDRGYY